MTNAISAHPNIYRAITARISEAISAGAHAFEMPWHSGFGGMPVNAATKVEYRGINVLSLWVQAQIAGFGSAYWASYRQWQSLGCHVRKGEKGTPIIFYKELEGDGADEGARKIVARSSFVFNSAQVDGWAPPVIARQPEAFLLEEVDSFVRATHAIIWHGAETARYRRGDDRIDMPDRHLFKATKARSATESYYAVLLHELVHWSGAPHRLKREFGERFADQAYAFEELVAELGSAFLCAKLGVSNEPRADHAAYVASWLEILNKDHKAIFAAARLAQDATEYLIDLVAARTFG